MKIETASKPDHDPKVPAPHSCWASSCSLPAWAGFCARKHASGRPRHQRHRYVHPVALLISFSLAGQCLATVFVDKDAPSGGDGNSWGSAYQTIQAGIDDALDEEVWVAAGTYVEAITMKDGVAVYGGFTGTETLLSQRDFHANVTIIDASTVDGGVPADHVVVMDTITNARLDGFTVTGGTADGADLGGKGGGILCMSVDDSNTIANCTITNNSTDVLYGQGGGMYLEDSTPAITRCTVTSNVAGQLGRGGAFYCRASSPTFADCTVSNNDAGGHGGGVGCENSSPVLNNCTINGNEGGELGGGVYLEDSSPTITDSVISGNSAWEGAGIMSFRSTPTILNTRLQGNHAGRWGGAVCAYDSSPITMSKCTIAGNWADGDGGGGLEFHEWSTPVVTNCVISGNWTSGNGGGVYLYISSGYYPEITNCTICGNSADGNGGGVYCVPRSDFMNATIRNTIFDGNGSHAVYEDGANADVTLTNCLFYNNSDGDVRNEGLVTLTGGDAVNTIPEASDNIDGDPSFVDRASENYRLLPNSACIDAGALTGAPTTDIIGVSRPQGSGVDIGAYEYSPWQDSDGDGIRDGDEVRDLDPHTAGVQNPFDPADPDSTGDSFQNTADGVPDGRNDYDGDGMSNKDELTFGYNPMDPGSWAEVPAATVITLYALVFVVLCGGGGAVARTSRRERAPRRRALPQQAMCCVEAGTEERGRRNHEKDRSSPMLALCDELLCPDRPGNESRPRGTELRDGVCRHGRGTRRRRELVGYGV